MNVQYNVAIQDLFDELELAGCGLINTFIFTK